MTSPSARRPGPPDPGTVELPAAAPEPARTGRERRREDTGPIPSLGVRPAPPPPRPRIPVPVEVDPASAPPPARRAGRNLGAAIGVGVALGAVILAPLLLYRPAFLLVLLAAVLVGVAELTRAVAAGDLWPPLAPVLVGAAAMIALAWTRGAGGLVVGFLLTVLAVLLWRLADGPVGYLHDAAAGVLVALYVPFLAGFAALLLVPDDGAVRVLAFIATVVANDVGGYAAGVLFGRHPMARHISPKKTWEGMTGSVIACVAVAIPLLGLALDSPWWGGIVFGVALAVSATVGDLGESLIKRDLGKKDMGHLLPGHGGIMDRLDSLLPSAAVAYLLLSVLAPA